MPDAAFGLLRLPEQVLFGRGTIEVLPRSVAEFGSRVFLCVDSYIATTDWFDKVVTRLSASGSDIVCIYSEVVPELPVESIELAAALARSVHPDVIVAIGGGSAIDLAKLVSLLHDHEGPLSRFYGENNVPQTVLPVIAVPTTAGTGSEVTPVAVVSDPGRELKVGVSSPQLIPKRAIVDPLLTVGAPSAVTAYAGIDAFVHAIESYTAHTVMHDWTGQLPVFVGRNRFSSLIALEAVRAIGKNLRTAVADPSDIDAREEMAWGSLLAGMAFGSGGTHLSHALQYPVGAATKTPHGLGTGLLLPYVLDACRPAITRELADIADALGVGSGTADQRADACIAEIRSLVVDIGVPTNLAAIGVAGPELERFVQLALGVTRLAGNAPVEPTADLLTGIVTSALSGTVPASVRHKQRESQ